MSDGGSSTFFLATALLVAVAIVSIAVTALQTRKLSAQRRDWEEEILRFRGQLNAATKRKMDNVVRAYGLQVDTRTSRKLNEDDRTSKIRWVKPKHRVFPDTVRWEVVDVEVENARWMLVKKNKNAVQLGTDVGNGDVSQLVLGGEVFDVRVISEEDQALASALERLESGPNVLAFQLSKANPPSSSSSSGGEAGTIVVHMPFVADKSSSSSPTTWSALKTGTGNSDTGSLLVHVWGYGVRRGAPRIAE